MKSAAARTDDPYRIPNRHRRQNHKHGNREPAPATAALAGVATFQAQPPRTPAVCVPRFAARTAIPRIVRLLLSATATIALTIYVGALPPPAARAEMSYGNYTLNIPDRYDFHTWIWAVTPCPDACVVVSALPQPVARAFEYSAHANLISNRYILTVDTPDGLRCGNIYYGATQATHDVYDWDATTLTGILTSNFDTGCDGKPGALTYLFTLARL